MMEQWWKESTLQARPAHLALFSVHTLRHRTPEVREVVYSQAENKTHISTYPLPRAPFGSKVEVLAAALPPVQPPISPLGLTYLSINPKQKQKLTRLLWLKFYPRVGKQFISNN